MEIIYSVFKGFGFGFGMLFGLGGTVILLAKIIKGTKTTTSDEYDAYELITPFTNYENKLIEQQKYEDVAPVQLVIKTLKTGIVPEEICKYRIKKDMTIEASDVNGKSNIKVVTTYVVKGKSSGK